MTSEFAAFYYTIPGESCAVLQILSFMMHDITDRINPEVNHKLYRKDRMFIYPSNWVHFRVKMKVREQQPFKFNNNRQKVKLSYYFGKYIRGPEQSCWGQYCHIQTKKAKPYFTSTAHGQVIYPHPVQPLHVTTETVSLPAGTNIDASAFRSFEVASFPYISAERSWVVSSIYHINCLKSFQKISNWSRLSSNLLKRICERDTHLKIHLKPTPGQYYVRPPYTVVSVRNRSTLWTLSIGCMQCGLLHNVTNIAKITHETDPKAEMCNSTKEKSRHFLVTSLFDDFFVYSCISLKTTIVFSGQHAVKNLFVGLQMFENTKMTFTPEKVFLDKGLENISIHYTWMSHKTTDHQEYNKKYRLLTYSQEHSWMMAAEECKLRGMTLPHWENERKTSEFVKFALDGHVLPTLALFVGLISKVEGYFWVYKNFKSYGKIQFMLI